MTAKKKLITGCLLTATVATLAVAGYLWVMWPMWTAERFVEDLRGAETAGIQINGVYSFCVKSSGGWSWNPPELR